MTQFIFGSDGDTKTKDVVDATTLKEKPRNIILYNDDVNTFEFVIESLIEVCEHDYLQAEQCTFLVHYKGKCAVKKGTLTELKPMCSALLDRGLSAEID